MHEGIYSHYDDNLIWDCTISANASPMSSYSLTTLQSPNPAARVRFSSGTVTISFSNFNATSPAPSASPNLLAIPVSNLEGSVLSLTNSAGLNISVPVPTMPDHRIPKTIVLDFSSQANRTAATYSLVIAGNVANVVLGGGIWLGAKRTLDRNFRYSFHELEDQPEVGAVNDYGVEYLADLTTQTRSFRADFNASATGREQLRAWHQAGRRKATLFWPDPTVNDAYLGHWRTPFDVERTHPRVQKVSLDFGEFCKGKPV